IAAHVVLQRTRFYYSLFFFQAEDGIRDDLVTGVQTCALPIWLEVADKAPSPEEEAEQIEFLARWLLSLDDQERAVVAHSLNGLEIGRASCRERVWMLLWSRSLAVMHIEAARAWLAARSDCTKW